MNPGQNIETVLITGASSGIGLELTKCFAAEGCRLVLLARNTPAMEQLAGELRRVHQVETIILTADLSKPETPRKAFCDLKDQNIAVDVLVNNAGFGAIGPFDELPLARQLEMLQVNITALTALTGLFLPGMIERRRGGILNVASLAAFVPGPGMAVYYATKAFVLSFTEALAGELQDTGLNISALCPGPTTTNFGNVAGSKNVKLLRTGRMTAEDVARAGHRAFRRGQAVVVPGFQGKVAATLAKITPKALIRKSARKFNGFKRKA